MSDNILTDLLLDNSGLSRSEKLMILTATHDAPTFDTAAKALIRQHGRIHIRESRNGQRPPQRPGKGNNKGYSSQRKSHGYPAYDEDQDDDDRAYAATDEIPVDGDEERVGSDEEVAMHADEEPLTAESIELDVLACFIASETFDENSM